MVLQARKRVKVTVLSLQNCVVLFLCMSFLGAELCELTASRSYTVFSLSGTCFMNRCLTAVVSSSFCELPGELSLWHFAVGITFQ